MKLEDRRLVGKLGAGDVRVGQATSNGREGPYLARSGFKPMLLGPKADFLRKSLTGPYGPPSACMSFMAGGRFMWRDLWPFGQVGESDLCYKWRDTTSCERLEAEMGLPCHHLFGQLAYLQLDYVLRLRRFINFLVLLMSKGKLNGTAN